LVFSSYLFLFYFLPVALLLYYAAPRRLKHLILTALSYVFYGWANPLFVPLLLFSTVVDFLCGLYMARVQGAARLSGAPGGGRGRQPPRGAGARRAVARAARADRLHLHQPRRCSASSSTSTSASTT
jgi:hypothetical protein